MLRARLADLIDVANGRGLEIGALDRPIITRDMGPIEYIDRAPRAELQAWYGGHGGVDPENIVEVDHIWGDQSLLECVGGARAFDYLVASHVIEHVPDVFGWLGEIAAVLVDGGLAVLFVPDKRDTFDILRPVSASGEFIDAYLRRSRRPDVRQVFNHVYEFRELSAPELDDAAITERAQGALAMCRNMQATNEYIDVHAWVFTPESLLQALDLASRLDLLPFEIQTLETAQGEFLIILRRLPDDWTAAARRAAFTASVARHPLPEEPAEEEISPEPEVVEPALPDEALAALALQAEALAAVARANAIETSTTWRMTAPLRAAIDSVRRLARR